MEKIRDFLRHHFWVVELALVGLCSGLAGVLAANVAAGYLVRAPKPPKHRRRPAALPAKKRVSLLKSMYSVTRRNIFCSSCEAEEQKPGQEGKGAVASVMDAELLATYVSEDPTWSMAAIRLTKPEERIVLVKQGAQLGDAVVIAIRPRRVELRRNEQVEFLDLLSDKKKRRGPPRRPRPPGGYKRPQDRFAKGIRKVGKNKYEIDRNVLNEFLANAANLGRGARIVPSRDGKGYRVYAVRSYSVFYKLGIRNGDVILGVNNEDITSPDKALELFTKLRGASHLTINVRRHGRPLTLEYTIR